MREEQDKIACVKKKTGKTLRRFAKGLSTAPRERSDQGVEHGCAVRPLPCDIVLLVFFKQILFFRVFHALYILTLLAHDKYQTGGKPHNYQRNADHIHKFNMSAN